MRYTPTRISLPLAAEAHEKQKDYLVSQKKEHIHMSSFAVAPAIWRGSDIHQYTDTVRQQAVARQSDIISLNGGVETVGADEFVALLSEIESVCGPKVTYSNLMKNYVASTGWIKDNEVPQLNSAVLLKLLWQRSKGDDSLRGHFNETLDQIGATCIQGISFRLFMDFLAFFASSDSNNSGGDSQ